MTVEDSTGKSKVVVHPDPAAAATGTWTRWAIPLSDFTSAGVKTTKVKKLVIGVGDRSKAKASGAGMLYHRRHRIRHACGNEVGNRGVKEWPRNLL